MDTFSALTIVLVIAAIAVCAVAAFALVAMRAAMRSVQRASDHLDERLVPMLDKLDITVDAANAELLRIDGIVTTFEDATARVSATTAAVHDAVNAPLEMVESMGTRVRTAWKNSRRSRDEAAHARSVAEMAESGTSVVTEEQ